jgi:transcriptional regulator GlxA family with amidase domain
VGVLAYPGCLAAEVFGVIDVVRVGTRVAGAGVNPTAPDIAVQVVTARKSLRLEVAAGAELRIAPRIDPLDVLVVPGFDSSVDEAEISDYLAHVGPEVEFIRSALGAGMQVVSICAGSFLVAEAGGLDGRRATTSWLHAPALRSRYPSIHVVESQLVVHDRGVSTTAAFSAMFDVTLQLLRATIGDHAAALTAKIMLLDEGRTDQTPYVDERLLAPAGNTFGSSVQRWLRGRLHLPFDLHETAAQFSVSPRTLGRRFVHDTGTTPLGFVQQERVRRARHLLTTTDQTVQQVARRVGYRDPSTFGQLFKERTGLSPREYRTRFAPRHLAPSHE